jgi:cell division protein FtsB
MTKEEKIQEIREALQNDRLSKAPQYISYLLSELDAANQEKQFWMDAAETQKNNNLAILRELDAAKQENERLLHRNESLFNEIEDYQQRLKQAEDVLAWYGDGSEDGGERARTTLFLIREEANKEVNA